MNYLAHLYFSKNTPESRLGNIMADFVKGTLDTCPYSPAIVEGIKNHRAVDRFTDTHHVVHVCKQLVSPHRRRFAGIIVDVCYDHFLAIHWDKYSPIELPAFIKQTYTSIQQYSGDMPDRLRHVLHYMIEHDWLLTYQTKAGVDRALNGISSYIKRENTLKGGIEELEQNYQAMERSFLDFFPDLVEYMGKWADKRISK
jgi:acyl carrier protein phosphodiesterase